jgi:hypothetical protein
MIFVLNFGPIRFDEVVSEAETKKRSEFMLLNLMENFVLQYLFTHRMRDIKCLKNQKMRKNHLHEFFIKLKCLNISTTNFLKLFGLHKNSNRGNSEKSFHSGKRKFTKLHLYLSSFILRNNSIFFLLTLHEVPNFPKIPTNTIHSVSSIRMIINQDCNSEKKILFKKVN